MLRVENECVGCPPEMGCLGSSCPYMNVERWYCDECDEEGQLYEYDGQELCVDCIAKRLEKVEGCNYE